jgi:hypothetical protein
LPAAGARIALQKRRGVHSPDVFLHRGIEQQTAPGTGPAAAEESCS